jgi:UDP-N-acetylmuramyl pentapeptide synthase
MSSVPILPGEFGRLVALKSSARIQHCAFYGSDDVAEINKNMRRVLQDMFQVLRDGFFDEHGHIQPVQALFGGKFLFIIGILL